MAAKVATSSSPTDLHDYEILEEEDDLLKAEVTSNQSTPWIDSSKLKLRHRIGRGPFGDVWLATHHHSTEDFNESHEVAIKMLFPVKQDHMRSLLDKFNELFYKCQGIGGVCWLQGVSLIGGRMCIIMKFYEDSVGNKMSHLKEGKLPLRDVIRYGINLTQGIMELHLKGLLVLNLKPCNFLLNEADQAIVGDVGVPYLLRGIPLPSSDMVPTLGSPNYMAPEQWQPEVRGPISFETDSWGFACSIVEMLTGVQPWRGKSADEIYDLVVRQHAKPDVPSCLPPAAAHVLLGCFEYDLRNRPLMKDILHVFSSLQDTGFTDQGWTGLESATILDKPSSGTGYTEWFLLKDHLQVGDKVRSRKPHNSRRLENMDIPEGTVVGVEHNGDRNGFVLVRVHGIHDPIRVRVSSLERVSHGLAAGDWVRLKQENKKHSPVGILHSIHRDGGVEVGFIGMESLWRGNSSELQMAEPYCISQFVRLKANILSPRFEWPRKSRGSWATGRISCILPNGCLIVKFPGRLTFGEEFSSFLADPAEVELVSFSSCPGMMKKYQHLEDFHWAVRPILVTMGLLMAMKVGFFIGKKMGRSKPKQRQSTAVQKDAQQIDGQTAGNPAWLPSSMTNMLFREGAAR